jgi:hypothetical protein
MLHKGVFRRDSFFYCLQLPCNTSPNPCLARLSSFYSTFVLIKISLQMAIKLLVIEPKRLIDRHSKTSKAKALQRWLKVD